MAAAETEVATKDEPNHPVVQFRDMLNSPEIIQALNDALPKHMTAERMIRVAMTALQRTPKLLECDKRSVGAAIIQASELGLEPNGVLGHAYLVPFKNGKTGRMEAQLMIGYKGMIDLVRRSSGKGTVITAEVVYEADDFAQEKGLNPTLLHVPSEAIDPGPVVGAYAVVRIEGQSQFTYLPLRDIEKLRKRSKAAKNGPWVTDYEWMCKKSAIRQLCKLLPMSIEDQEAVARDELRDLSVMQGDNFIDVEANPQPKSLEDLDKSLGDDQRGENGEQIDSPVAE